jgi:phosphoglycolate phosphatase
LNIMQSPQLMLIDLDGTLIDSMADLAYSIDQMLIQLSMPVRGVLAISGWVGNGAERLVKRALLNSMDGEPDVDLFQTAMPVFNAIYAANNGTHSYLYDGVIEGLDYLRKQECLLGCVTNKPAAFTIPLLELKGISAYFDITICGDEVERPKPDPQPLLLAAEKMKIDPQHTIMLGDSIIDVQAARAAGMPIICVSYGYSHGQAFCKQERHSHAPDAVIDSLAELKTLI